MPQYEATTCFVIMPFGAKDDPNGNVIDFNAVYDHIIRPAVEGQKDETGITCLKCDDIAGPGLIQRDMIEHIRQDDIAVVDITLLNANVFYELGIRHALRRNATVLIRKRGTKIPFDIRMMRVIDYDLDVKSAAKAIESIRASVEAGLRNKRNDSPVYDVFPDLTVS